MKTWSSCVLAVVLLCCPARAEFNMAVKTDGIRLGPTLLGSVRTDDLKGHVVLLDFWGISCPPCLAAIPKIAAMNNELGPFGLVIVGAHAQKGTDEQIKRMARSRGANFPIVQFAAVEGGQDFRLLPHSMLFDHTGKCIYRGEPLAAESRLRQALGAALADTGSKTDPVPSVGLLLLSLRKGTSPAKVLRQAVTLMKSSHKTEASDAAALVERLTAVGKQKLDEANKVVESDPLRAYDLAQTVANTWKGSPVATSASTLLNKLKKDKGVALEMKARPTLEAMRKLDQLLSARATAAKVEPNNPDFLKANRANISQLRSRLSQIKKMAPDAKATAEATTIAQKYGITLK
jgi:thiol-disulfide isomerase/thioredoxin